MTRTAAALSAVLALAVTSTPAVRSAARRPPVARIDWKPCGERKECGTLRVPLDYRHPKRGTITVALQRSRATDPPRRIGSLLVNPGGPGASGLDLGPAVQNVLQSSGGEGPELAARFDFIGFDPRGVGDSTPVQCEPSLDRFYGQDATPGDAAEKRALITEMRRMAQACERRSRALLPFVGTPDAAHDLDGIRAALGEDRLYFLGFSYGTDLGTAYAEQFPDRVGRLVLDGAIDPNLSGVELARQQAQSLEQSFNRFAAACAADPRCPFRSDGDPAGAFDRLMARLDAAPLPAGNGRTVGASQAVSGIATALFDQSQWPGIARALALAAGGEGSGLLRLFDSYTERSRDGTYPNLAAANLAINCLDYRWPRGEAGYKTLVTDLAATSPRFGQAFLWEFLPCAYWPVSPHPKAKPKPVHTAPILVIGTTGDPSTPYAWSQALAAALPDSTLLTRNGEGHTAFLGGNGCIDSTVDTYLLTGVPPPGGTTC